MKKIILILLIYIGVNATVTAQPLLNNEFDKVMELPPLPKTLVFAGDTVPLWNYDTRESLMRELLSIIYTHSQTAITILLTSRYFPIIEPILKANGIPDDLKYLCVTESRMDQNAVSGSKAAGIWQIMPSTAEQYGYEIGETVDQRYDVEKSTKMACDYLKKSYEKFGSWSFACAAYNIGNKGVARRKNIQGIDNYYDMFLPEQTLRYVFRILACKLIIENPEKYGYFISANDMYKPLTDYRIETISDSEIDWSAFARSHGTTYKMIREINPWIRDYTHSNPTKKTYSVKIPNKNFRKIQKK